MFSGSGHPYPMLVGRDSKGETTLHMTLIYIYSMGKSKGLGMDSRKESKDSGGKDSTPMHVQEPPVSNIDSNLLASQPSLE
jgi:hypothetical protein